MIAAGRLLFVHAHPDDESIGTGATMARYAAAGARVVLVTCTRGEEGEIIPAELAHLAADRDGLLAAHRERELAAALAALGVREQHFLDQLPGAPGRYRDSGMAGTRANLHPDSFCRADLDAAAAVLAALIGRLRPNVAVGYDPGGGYGHPDHIQAHRILARAIDLAAGSWPVPKVYWIVVPRSVALSNRERSAARPGFAPPEDGAALPSMVLADDLVTTAVDATAHLPAKVAALRAHATQVSVHGDVFALSNRIAQPLTGVEYYRLARGEPGGPRDADGRERDLLAGL